MIRGDGPEKGGVAVSIVVVATRSYASLDHRSGL